MGKTQEAIGALTILLDISPTDAEGWAELADLYLTNGLYAQAIYALEEVLVLVPNAWNVRCVARTSIRRTLLLTGRRCKPD